MFLILNKSYSDSKEKSGHVNCKLHETLIDSKKKTTVSKKKKKNSTKNIIIADHLL